MKNTKPIYNHNLQFIVSNVVPNHGTWLMVLKFWNNARNDCVLLDAETNITSQGPVNILEIMTIAKG